MPGKGPKEKGNRLERLIVARATAAGIHAKRAWGSNGRALGFSDDVDVLMGGLKVQAKARKGVADYIKPPAGADVTVVHEVKAGPVASEPLVVVPLHLFLRLARPSLDVVAEERREQSADEDANHE